MTYGGSEDGCSDFGLKCHVNAQSPRRDRRRRLCRYHSHLDPPRDGARRCHAAGRCHVAGCSCNRSCAPCRARYAQRRARQSFMGALSCVTPCVTPNGFRRFFAFAICVQLFDFIGGRTRTRTWDPLIKSQLLYQLSYAPGIPPRSPARAASCSKASSHCPGKGQMGSRIHRLRALRQGDRAPARGGTGDLCKGTAMRATRRRYCYAPRRNGTRFSQKMIGKGVIPLGGLRGY